MREVADLLLKESDVVDDNWDEDLSSHDERREYNRSRFIVDVHFDGQDATGVASTKDISLGGFYMNTQAEFREGSLLMVRIPFGPGKEVVARVEVVYSNPGKGVGLKFRDLTAADRALLLEEVLDK